MFTRFVLVAGLAICLLAGITGDSLCPDAEFCFVYASETAYGGLLYYLGAIMFALLIVSQNKQAPNTFAKFSLLALALDIPFLIVQTTFLPCTICLLVTGCLFVNAMIAAARTLQPSVIISLNILLYDFCEEAHSRINDIVSKFRQLNDPVRLRLYINAVSRNNSGNAFHYKPYTENSQSIIQIAVSMERIEGILHALEKIHAISPAETRSYRDCIAHIKTQANNVLLATQKITAHIEK